MRMDLSAVPSVSASASASSLAVPDGVRITGFAASPTAADDALLGAFDTEIRSGTFSIRSLTGTGRLTLSGGSLSFSQTSSIGAMTMTAASEVAFDILFSNDLFDAIDGGERGRVHPPNPR